MTGEYLLDGANLVICSIAVLTLGSLLTRKLAFLAKYNIPVAVTGGLIFSIFFTLLYQAFDIRVTFDLELRDTLLMAFFSTIGLSAKFKTLVTGGKTLAILLLCAVTLLIVQDVTGVLVALGLDVHPAYGLFAGSISFAGGHGTAIAWGDIAAQAGLPGASTLGIACATFGLIAGGLIGGPFGGFLVKKHGLASSSAKTLRYEVAEPQTATINTQRPLEQLFNTFLMIALCLAIGTNINSWLSGVGVLLPQFLTAMFVGIVITNLADIARFRLYASALDRTGEVCLHLFLAMSLMSIELWQLASAMGPLLIIICAQMIVVAIVSLLLVYNFTGRNYDAAVIAVGFMGLGLGATPVAIANMQAMTGRYGPSTKAFLVVPLVGAFFIDLSNAAVIKAFSSLPLLQRD